LKKFNKKKAEKLAKKIKKGKTFDLEDFRDQIKQISNMGGMMGIMSKLPGMGQLPDNVKDQMNDRKLVEIEALINSMTPKERRNPELLKKGSRKRRVTEGSGRTIQELNQLLKQFAMMQKMMKKMKKGGMKNMMRGMMGKLGGGGGFPPGGMPPGGMPPGFPGI
jgi:signal recognition particle subunit SRP54